MDGRLSNGGTGQDDDDDGSPGTNTHFIVLE